MINFKNHFCNGLWAILLLTLLAPSIMAQDITTLIESVPDSLSASSNAIILYDDTDVTLSDDEYTATHSTAILVLNKRAEEYLSVQISYKEGSEKIKHISIHVYDESGQEIKKAGQKDMEDVALGDGYSMITDRRMKTWTYDNEIYPKIISYNYTVISQNTLSLPVWYPIPGYNVGVLKSSYQLHTDQSVVSKRQNLAHYPTIDASEYKLSIQHQKSLDHEPYSPDPLEIFPIVIMRPVAFNYENKKGMYSSWQDFGKWMSRTFLEDLPQIKDKGDLDKIIQPTNDTWTKAKKIYDYVQENTRYVSISLDDGGLKPLSPQKVHDVKYGDCKALSYYMHNLLQLYDIPSHYTVVHAGSDRQIDLFADFPSTYPGNHVIINIPTEQDTLWVDCTSHDNPFDYLGRFTDDRQVLSVGADNSHLIRTPRYTHDDNLSETTVSLQLSEDGAIHADVHEELSGILIDRAISLLHADSDDIKEHLRDKKYGSIKQYDLRDEVITLDEQEKTAVIAYSISGSNYTETAGQYTFVPMSIAALDIPKLPKDGHRVYPILMERGSTQIITIRIPNPQAKEIVESIEEEYQSDYGSYSITSSIDEGNIIIAKKFVLYEGQYDPQDYGAIRSFFNKCIKMERKPLALSDKK